MSNPFSAKQSGMSSLLENMLPPDVLEAIRIAKEQLPAVIDAVQKSVQRIETKLDSIERKLDNIYLAFDDTRVPDTLPSQTIEVTRATNGNAST